MQIENTEMDDPCKDCLILAKCRNKGWLQILEHCIKIASFIGKLAVREKDTTVEIPSLRKSYVTYKDKVGQVLIGPVNHVKGTKNE